MRIAVVHSYYSSRTPSGENIVVDLQADALRRAGHEVTVVSAHTDRVGTSGLHALRSALRVATGHGDNPLEAIERIAPDVVHLHNLFPNGGQSWLARLTTPLVATLHNYRPLCSNAMLARDGHDCTECLEHGSTRALIHACYRGSRLATLPLAIATRDRGTHNEVLRRAAALVCLAERSRDTYVSAQPQLAERLHVIPNFTVAPARRLPVDSGGPWLFVGRLTPEKGVLQLIEHWPADQPLVVVGSGPLEHQARAAAAGKDIRFTGQVPRPAVEEHLQRARALVFSSVAREGAAAMTYVEALAAGRPTLSIGTHNVSDDVLAAGTGVSTTFADLPDALRSLTETLQDHAARALAHHAERYSPAAWLRAIEALYDAVK